MYERIIVSSPHVRKNPFILLSQERRGGSTHAIYNPKSNAALASFRECVLNLGRLVSGLTHTTTPLGLLPWRKVPLRGLEQEAERKRRGGDRAPLAVCCTQESAFMFNIMDSTVLEFDSHENRILCLKKKKVWKPPD